MPGAKSKERRDQVEVSLGFIYSGILSLLLVQKLHSSLHKFFQLSSESRSLPKAEVFQVKWDFGSTFYHFFPWGIGKAPVWCYYH